MAERKPCPECGELYQGRIDKRYCSDYCRNVANNRNNKDTNKLVTTINHRLRKNRRILEALNTTGKTKVHRMKLQDEGFDFNYHTNIYTTKNDKTYVFCYDQGY